MNGLGDILDEMPDDLILEPREVIGVVGWRLLFKDDMTDVVAMLRSVLQVALPRSFFWDC